VVPIQCLVRCAQAKVLLRKKRAAAKDVGKLQLNNEALKLEIEQLKARAADDTRRVIAENEERSAAAAAVELIQLREELKASRKELEEERSVSLTLVGKLQVSESDFMKATTQILELKGLMSTEDSENEEEKGPLSRSPPMTPVVRGRSRTDASPSSSARVPSPVTVFFKPKKTPTPMDQGPRKLPGGSPRSPQRIQTQGSSDGEGASNGSGSIDNRGAIICLEEEVSRLRAVTKDLSNQLQAFQVQPHSLALIESANGSGSKKVSPRNRVNSAAVTDGNSTKENGTANAEPIAPVSTKEMIYNEKQAMATFERNLVTLRSKLRQGYAVQLWEEGIYLYLSIKTYIYVYLYIYMCVYICIYIYVCIHVYVCMYLYLYIFIFKYVDIYASMFIHRSQQPGSRPRMHSHTQ
jgi:hypothetical protein